MTELSASNAAYSLRDDERPIYSTYADNDIGYSCFHYSLKGAIECIDTIF